MRIFFIVITIFILGCRSNQTDLGGRSVVKSIDTLIYTDNVKLFTELDSSDGFRFIYYKNDKEIYSSRQMLMGAGMPTLESFNKRWVYLTGGCGSGCFFGNLISLQKEDSVKLFMFPVFFDQKNNLIMFCDNEILVVENFELGRKMEIKDIPITGPYCSYGIKSVVYNNYFITLSYVTSEYDEVKKWIDIGSLFR